MSDNSVPDPDPCDNLLAPVSCPDDTADLRQALLRRTTRVLRRRRLIRRVGLVAALAACYFAGVLTMYLLTPSAAVTVPVVVYVHPSEPSAPKTLPQPQEMRATMPAPTVEHWAARTEAPPERSQLYRQAGDRYMQEENDPASALRCYTKALDAGSPADTSISPDDNWLLMALKDAREKEKRHADNGS
jgi:hypothetical protein